MIKRQMSGGKDGQTLFHRILPATPRGGVNNKYNCSRLAFKSKNKMCGVGLIKITVFLTQIISCRQKKCRHKSCIIDFTLAKTEFTSAVFKKLYFSKYSIKGCCKQIPPFKNLSDHTNKFLME